MFVNNREIFEKLRGVNSVYSTELTPRSFSNISLFLYMNQNYDERRIYFVKDIFDQINSSTISFFEKVEFFHLTLSPHSSEIIEDFQI